MNKKTINRIILFMSITLVVLITFQLWWLNGSYQIYKQQVHKELDAALYSSLRKESEIRLDKFKKEYSHVIDFNTANNANIASFINMAMSNAFPEGSHIDMEKLKDICKKELRKRKIKSKFQFKIDNLLRGTSYNFPQKANYSPIVQSIQYQVGNLGHNKISLNISSIDDYVYSNMQWSLFSTIFLILFNSGCLLYMLYTIIRQKQVAEMRNDFISNMTHEFKTPIATISAATEAIRTFINLNQNEKVENYLDISKNEAKKLNSLVEEILNISIYDKKDFVLQDDIFALKPMIKDTVQKFKIKNQDVHFSFDCEHEFNIRGDKFHLQNVINNLIDNAIKYSDTTKVIKIRVYRDVKGLTIAVKDYGKGISKSQQRYIFEKFYRAHTGDIHQVKGFGLGLCYVKQIIEKHKGEIELKSTVGKGSEFFVYLPLNREITI